MTGPSGFGKTALLVNWIRADRADLCIAYTFISRLDGLADEAFTLQSLCEQLAAYHDERGSLPSNLAELRSLYVTLLTRPSADGKRLVVVIDGLDEATGWTPRPDLFPPQLPKTAQVVVSARTMAGVDWLAALGLAHRDAAVIELETLGVSEIGRVLAAADAPPGWANGQLVLEEIHRVSRGDPFYVQHLVEDISSGAISSPSELAVQPSGIDGYFDAWWGDLRASATAAAVRDLLGYLIVGRAPLSRDDLTEISGDNALDGWNFEEALALVRRYVNGSEQTGFSLAHPRFRDWIAARRIKPSDQQPFLDRLLAYCSRWREHRSRYALANYVQHLIAMQDTNALVALIDKEWIAARFEQTSGHAAAAEDAASAIASALANEKVDPVDIVRLALIRSTLGSFVAWLPPQLLAVRARCGQADVALRQAALVADEEARAKSYALIAEGLLDDGDRDRAREAALCALRASRAEGDDWKRRGLIASLSPLFARIGEFDSIANELAPWLWNAAWSLRAAIDHASAIGALESVIAYTSAVDDLSTRLSSLVSTADALLALGECELASSVLHDARDVARRVEQQTELASTFAVLSRGLSSIGDHSGGKEFAFASLSLAQQEGTRHGAFPLDYCVAALVDAGATEEAFSTSLDEISRNNEIGVLASAVDAALARNRRDAAFEAVRRGAALADAIEGEPWRAPACAEVAALIVRTGRVEDAWSVAERIHHEGWRSNAYLRIASNLAGDGRYADAIAAAEVAADSDDRSSAFLEIAERMAASHEPDGALQVARRIDDQQKRAVAQAAIAVGLLQRGERTEACELAANIPSIDRPSGVTDIVSALTRLAEAIADDKKSSALIDAALVVARAEDGTSERATALIRAASALANNGDRQRSAGVFDEAETVALSLTGDHNRDVLLTHLVERRGDAGLLTLDSVQHLAEAVVDDDDRARLLIDTGRARIDDDPSLAVALLDHALSALAAERKRLSRARADRLEQELLRLSGAVPDVDALRLRSALEAVSPQDDPAQAVAESSDHEDADEEDELAIRWRQSARVDELGQGAQELLDRDETDGLIALADEALATARSISGRDSLNDDAFETAGRIYAAAGRIDKTFEAFAAMRPWPRSRACLDLAGAADKINNTDLARAAWVAAVEAAGDSNRDIIFSAVEAAPEISPVGSQATLEALAHTIVEVESWWRPELTAALAALC